MPKPNYQALIDKIHLLSVRLQQIGLRANAVHRGQDIKKSGHVVAKLKDLIKDL